MLQRMLLAGAGVGIAFGLVGQLAVTDAYAGDIEWLVRGALLLPGVVFVVWWLAFPSVRPIDANTSIDPVKQQAFVDRRIERIESSFDSAAVPSARRSSIEPSGRDAPESFDGTIRRADASTRGDLDRFAVRRIARVEADEQPRSADLG